MDVKKKIKLIVILIFLVLIGIVNDGSGVSPDFTVYFKKEIDNTRERLKVLHNIFSTFPKHIKPISYAESSVLRIAEPDPTVPKPTDPTQPPDMIGLEIDLGFSGSGPLTQLTGFMVDIRLDSLPKFLYELFAGAMFPFLRPFIDGKVLVDPKTKRRILKSSKLMEFIFKMILLALDMMRKDDDPAKIDARFFNNQLILLLYRLTETPGFTDINDVFKQLPSFFKPLFDQIKISGKSAQTYVTFVWKEFSTMRNYDFTKPDTTELTNKDIPQIIKIMTAIVLRALVDYSKAKNAFVQTPAGKAAAAELKETGNNAAFNAQMPGFEQVKSDTIAHSVDLIKRFKAFRALKTLLLARIRPLANDLLKPLGMSVDDFFPSEEGALSPEEEAMRYGSSELFEEDPMFGTGLEQFEAIPEEEDSAVPGKAPEEEEEEEDVWIEGGEEVVYV